MAVPSPPTEGHVRLRRMAGIPVTRVLQKEIFED